MSTINERIAAVVEHCGYTKTAFGKEINLSQSMISKLCSGAAAPSDRTIDDICRVFNINKTWMLSGTGNMVSSDPAWHDIYWALENGDNPLHFLFRNNADCKTLAEYLCSCGIERNRPRSGKWIPVMDPEYKLCLGEDIIMFYQCSVCGRHEATREPFCNCGARMEK